MFDICFRDYISNISYIRKFVNLGYLIFNAKQLALILASILAFMKSTYMAYGAYYVMFKITLHVLRNIIYSKSALTHLYQTITP